MNFGNEDESNDDVRWGSPSDSGRRCNLKRSPVCTAMDVELVSPTLSTGPPSTASGPYGLDAIREETETQTDSHSDFGDCAWSVFDDGEEEHVDDLDEFLENLVGSEAQAPVHRLAEFHEIHHKQKQQGCAFLEGGWGAYIMALVGEIGCDAKLHT
eukprot:CAMPEP_0194511380 /NCGR_PEP_ID=MMETSP0253-20130528/43037_1 /TAXON_ID=2966 /ORGANISM="Noctiluca scintillans" /LENGTH=155 /DNA_ID=CAMNT_0039354713 /DNA_START=100 /DNA_END=567 /DNA_ORIENTATION=+